MSNIHKPKLCSVCHNEYIPIRWIQYTCSTACSKVRAQIKDKANNRYSKRPKIEIQCKYDGCKKIIQVGGNSWNKKYCEKHRIEQRKKSRRLDAQKKHLKLLETRPPKYCDVCKKQLALHKRKYCSEFCRYRGANKITRLRNLKEKIQRHEANIKRYEELIQVAKNELGLYK